MDDASEAIILAAEKYKNSEPVNIGTGSEITIKDLVNLVAELTGFKGEIIWNKDTPGGQPKRHLDTVRR
ncbi:MAG: hypothetical protein NWE93_10730 [Candidatus Bathyarchaeota archaeon]|nr:hypothetical protein [Candidatus Bathyarchaeota archaeon]